MKVPFESSGAVVAEQRVNFVDLSENPFGGLKSSISLPLLRGLNRQHLIGVLWMCNPRVTGLQASCTNAHVTVAPLALPSLVLDV